MTKHIQIILIALQALDDIADPITALKRNLKPGESLNGPTAINLKNSPDHLRNIATTAIKQISNIIDKE
ncbi:MAG: hypothetical protein Q7K40_03110 [bacterium]|nr:hypothetical protein [bacterium]